MYDQSTVLDSIGNKSSTLSLSVSLGWDMVAASCNFVCVKHSHERTARKPTEISSGRFKKYIYIYIYILISKKPISLKGVRYP
jgi:hypothetical protein